MRFTATENMTSFEGTAVFCIYTKLSSRIPKWWPQRIFISSIPEDFSRGVIFLEFKNHDPACSVNSNPLLVQYKFITAMCNFKVMILGKPLAQIIVGNQAIFCSELKCCVLGYAISWKGTSICSSSRKCLEEGCLIEVFLL